MSGLYLHIPFCRQACHYCNFHFSTSLRQREPLVRGLLRELELRADEVPGRELQTIYLGGGTPSLLPPAELEQLFTTIDRLFRIAPDAEITLEANPDDLTPEQLQVLRSLPVNRLSIGIQSFSDEDLAFMNRAHTAAEATASLERALAAGFDNLTVDLIYGTPTTSDVQWAENIRRVVGYGIPHLSCYALTVEPKTALDHFVRKGKVPDTDESQSARQFEYLMDALAAAGYEHYEISNFARPGRYSRHNTSYWRGEPYLGIGPSAHSFDGRRTRRWNVANNAVYIRALTGKDATVTWYESEVLSKADQYNEYVMTRLRTQWGVEVAEMAKIDPAFAEYFQYEVRQPLEAGLIVRQGNAFVLSRPGKLLADRVAAQLFWVSG